MVKEPWISQSTFWGYKAGNPPPAASACAHPCCPARRRLVQTRRRGGRQKHKGHQLTPAPYGRRHSAPTWTCISATLIGTGCIRTSPRGGDRHRGRLGEESGRRNQGDGKPVAYFGIEQHERPTTPHAGVKSRKATVQWPPEVADREERPAGRDSGSPQVRRVGHHLRRGANRRAGNALDKLYRTSDAGFGETTELTGGRNTWGGALPQ